MHCAKVFVRAALRTGFRLQSLTKVYAAYTVIAFSCLVPKV